MSITLGPIYARLRVPSDGDFKVRIAISSYPDAAARQWHTVLVAANSSALLNGAQEGAAVAVQADLIPGIDVVTTARLVWTSLVIDGTTVPALVAARDATHYRISYSGHLRAGVYSAYFKWVDEASHWGYRDWSFHIGSPYAVNVAPSLHLSADRIHLGDTLGVTGNNFTPGAMVTIRLGAPNAPPGVPVAKGQVDATGAFQLSIRIVQYPSSEAPTYSTMYIDVTASGAMVGDLPEGVAMPVQVTA
jgi:hypothetical protein